MDDRFDTETNVNVTLKYSSDDEEKYYYPLSKMPSALETYEHEKFKRHFHILFENPITKTYYLRLFNKYIPTDNIDNYNQQCKETLIPLYGPEVVEHQFNEEKLHVLGAVVKAFNEIMLRVYTLTNTKKWKFDITAYPWKMWYRTNVDSKTKREELNQVIEQDYYFIIAISEIVLKFICAYDDFRICGKYYFNCYTWLFNELELFNDMFLDSMYYVHSDEFDHWIDLNDYVSRIDNIKEA